MSDRRCPKCSETIVEPHRDGGGDLFLRTRSLRLTQNPAGAVIACPKCGTELEVQRGRLVFFVRRPPSGQTIVSG